MTSTRWLAVVFLLVATACNESSDGMVVLGTGGAGGTSGISGNGGTNGFTFPGNGDAGPIAMGDANNCPGGICVDPNGDAMPASQCGNGVLETGEVCDDLNAMPGDGCSGLCRLEPNFRCPVVGEACLSTVACGDGMVGGKEGCDDKNFVSGDGCTDGCQVEPGYGCATAGALCTKIVIAACGDRVVNMGETCDDGGNLNNDGCSKDCQLEVGFSCPTPGEQCVADEYCGNGNLADTEECDDKNGDPGDGCTGLCRREPFFVCPQPGMLCQSTIVCGDSKVIGDEACDDGNKVPNDGCAADCKSTEPGFTCPRASGVGGMCIPVPTDRCGDGRLSIGEFCDDGNTDATDGCTDVCQVTPGYTCPAAGVRCMLIEWCGDGKLSLVRGEECDDGDAIGGDGCSATCAREANYVCPQPGMDCTSTVRCGDGIVSGNETCDDRDMDAGDGCNQNCQVELGWVCPAGGVCRAERCGDGRIAGTEKCDDGNSGGGDGCSNVCQIEPIGPTEGNGWLCAQPGVRCTRTTCGNGIREGSEQCDDGDNDTGDGCGPLCRNEPLCAGGPCVTQCGDGLLLAIDKQNGQQCDDGNTVSGDGCSDACKVEAGFVCTDTVSSANPLILPIVYRDFKAYENGGQVEFQWSMGDPIDRTPTQDIWARTALGTAADTLPDGTSLLGKPVFKWYVSCNGTGCNNLTPGQGQVQPANTLGADTCNGFKNNATGVRDMTQWGRPVFWCGYGAQDFVTFSQWYRDVPNVNQAVVRTINLDRLMNGSYQYSSTSFFPLDGQAFGNETWAHNYHFTSEVRYWFEYDAAANANLTFFGDDDVWVYVGGRLVVDISGTHGQVQDGVTLNANTTDISGASLGLVDGSVYEIVVFQAERNCCGSNYQLNLSNFSSTRSSCQSVCGDTIVTADESCDLGTANNTGAYGACNANCTLPARCGDNITQAGAGEACDDGSNLATYSTGQMRCGPGCQWAPRCGDGMVDGAQSEACDQGADNGKGYGYCTATCQLGPRCGDEVTSNGEQCDDGNANGNSQSACSATCTLKCGNGVVDGGEQCDDGMAQNTGGYGKCNNNCTLGPRCGDGIKSNPEQCDDGRNDGSYGTCAPMCVLGPRCGDGAVQDTALEQCDLGTINNTGGYGKGLCTAQCRPAPYCGNRSVDIGAGEKCDDGVNSGMSGSCTPDCKGWVELPECGDANLDAGELCDDGLNVNGSAGSMCDVRCRKKCGNGFVDAGEQCDNGQNDGSYGTCTATCQLADYCGDGKKNGSEACDLGFALNQVNPYGMNTCTTLCTQGGYCGDGRIQSNHEEQCDGQAGCAATCTWPIPE